MRAVCGSATGGEMSERACVSSGIGVRVRKNLDCEQTRHTPARATSPSIDISTERGATIKLGSLAA